MALLVMTFAAWADVIYVDINADGANNGTTWDDAYTDLNAALTAAQSGYQIWVAAGTYISPTYQMKDGVAVYGGFSGTETQLNERNWQTHVTILDGNGASRVITGAGNARLDGFTISNGSASTGGGMYNENCSPTIENCIFLNNLCSSSSARGGAIYNNSASPTIINCTFDGNRASSSGITSGATGGAITNLGTSAPVIRNCRFNNNRATGGSQASSRGGAICSYSGTSLTIENSSFTANYAQGWDGYGGAIYEGGAAVELTNCLFSRNYCNNSTNIRGGALYNSGGQVTLTNCTLSHNWASGSGSRGGGIYNSSCTPIIKNSIIWGNSAASGQQISGYPSASATISYSCIEGGWSGTGNISSDPLFVDSDNHDCHLQSQVGHWSSGGWIPDAATSPCIDTANAADPYSNEPDPNGNQINMGAYGNTEQASKSNLPHFTINASAGSNGTIDPVGTLLIAQGKSLTFTITPDLNYAVVDVVVDSASVGPVGEYTFSNINANHTISVTFAPGHKITASAGSGGSINPSGEVWVANGQNKTFHFVPDMDYLIGEVAVDSVSQGSPSQYTFTAVDQAHTISVSFTHSPHPYLQVNISNLSVQCAQGQVPPASSFEVWNASIGNMSYTVNDDAGWLECVPNSGYSSGEHDTIAVNYNTSALSVGTYNATITITGNGAGNSPTTIPVTLEVFAPVIYVKHDAGGANNGTSWNDAFTTLQSALAAARGGNQLWIAQGTNNSSGTLQMKSGVDMYGGFNGTETALEQRDWQNNVTTIDGQSAARVLNGASAVLDGFTITGGSGENGGALYNDSCSPVIRNCIFNANSGVNGGAIYSVASPTTIHNCSFTSNQGSSGGAIYQSGATLDISSCNFNLNQATRGGGVYSTGSCQLQLVNCNFTTNKAISQSTNGQGQGGAIASYSGSCTVTKCTFTGNYGQGDSGYGGAIYNSGTLTLAYCLFSKNYGNGSLNSRGGAIYNSKQAMITNCTFSKNWISNGINGSSYGGAFYNTYDTSNATIKNCIFWNNTGIHGPQIYNDYLIDVSYSCVQGGWTGAGNIDSDPLFIDADNSDCHLQSQAGRWTTGGWINDAVTSPAIDVGLATDNCDNEPDPNGSQINMGAYGNTDQASKSTRIHHTITASAGTHGTIAPTGAVSVADGQNKNFAITPDSGYAILDVEVDSASVGAVNQYSFTNVTGNHTIAASFILGHKITASAGSGGAISPNGEIAVAPGRNQSFTITADSGYAIADVIIDGSSAGAMPSYTFANVTATHTIEAIFVEAAYLQVNTNSITNSCRYGSNASAKSLEIWNAGVIGTVDYIISDDVDWLECTPSSGNATATHDTITVNFSTVWLNPGNYTATITVTAAQSQNSPQVIQVNLAVLDTVIYVKGDANGAANGTSWSDAYPDLQSALNAAQSGEQIWVAQGTYKPTTGTSRTASFQMKTGVDLYGGFAGTEKRLKQRDFRANETILSGDIGVENTANDNVYHVVKGASSILDGFTVSHGRADGSDSNSRGGGMYNKDCSPIVRNCVFSNNYTADYYGSGGGMYNENTSAQIINCSFLNNISGGVYGIGGGGVYNKSGSPVIINCLFQGNRAQSNYNPYGGGMLNDCTSVTITGCVFIDNLAGFDGGAIENWESTTATISNCLFINNSGGKSKGGSRVGGAIDNDGAGMTCTAIITNCTFTGNSSAIYSMNSGSATVKNSIIWGNSAAIGGPATVTYSCIQGGYTGEGNIDADPLFTNSSDPDGADNIWRNGDDGLQLQASKAVSPCIDTASSDGAPGEDIRGATRSAGVGFDMGAYESAATDTTAPANVTSFLATGADQRIVLSWKKPISADLAGIMIRRSTSTYPASPGDGELVYNGSESCKIDNGLSNGTTYYYTAFSYDVVPNYSSGAQTSATPDGKAPVIITHPVAQSKAPGDQAIFSVVAHGSPPLNYQWYKDSVTIGGATDASYTIPNVQAGNAGSYKCLIVNNWGNVESNTAVLTVCRSGNCQPSPKPDQECRRIGHLHYRSARHPDHHLSMA